MKFTKQIRTQLLWMWMFNAGFGDEQHPVPVVRQSEGQLHVLEPGEGLIKRILQQKGALEGTVARIEEVNAIMLAHARVSFVQLELYQCRNPVFLVRSAPADGSLCSIEKRAAKSFDPVLIDNTVGVSKQHDSPARFTHAMISRRSRAAWRLSQHPSAKR
jgi:hypothetical protein